MDKYVWIVHAAADAASDAAVPLTEALYAGGFAKHRYVYVWICV